MDPDPSAPIAEAAQQLLADLAGPDAVLREDQIAGIEAVVRGRRRTLVVQRTGWGKSAVYFIATALLRAQGAGPTLLVSPLLALMRDQIANARRIGISAETINSTNLGAWSAIEARVLAGGVDLLCISPERLNSPGFRTNILPKLAAEVGLFVVDEAHCLSDWGHDFRPDYRRIRDFLDGLGDTPVLACTATANDRVIADVTEQLGTELLTLRGTLDRDSLVLSVLEFDSATERLAKTADLLGEMAGSGVIYTLTVAEADRVAAFCQGLGHNVAAYSSGTDPAERERIEAALRTNELKAVVATSALGMGFDKPDLAFVIHCGSPSSPVAYYQQVGRAGRQIARAEAVLLPHPSDRRIWEFFDATSFPPEALVRQVLAYLEEAGGEPVSVVALEQSVNLGRMRLESMLKILDVDGAVERVAGGWRHTGQPWVYDVERLERIRRARQTEQRAMVTYQRTDGCRMEFLRRELDDPAAAPCGRCDNCTGNGRSPSADGETIAAARQFIRGQDLEIAPRKVWPKGAELVGRGRSGTISIGIRHEPGRALGAPGAGGWGDLLGDLTGDPAELLDDEVMTGFFAMLRRWQWESRPTWVTYLPSTRHSGLVELLAEKVAAAGRLEIHRVFSTRRSHPPQDEMHNSAHQATNAFDTLMLDPAEVLASPVLLLDDTTRSGWTLAAASALLREAGSGPVLPAVLLQTR